MPQAKQALTAGSIARTLAQWTVNNSGHDPDRAYLGMSQIAKQEEELVRAMLGSRWEPTEEDHHRLILGHIFENDMVTRLWESGLVTDEVYYRDFDDEVVAGFDERFRGHIDGYLVDGSLLEIKSTFQDKLDRIQSGGRLPTAVYCQVQMYLCHGTHPKASRSGRWLPGWGTAGKRRRCATRNARSRSTRTRPGVLGGRWGSTGSSARIRL